MGMKLVGRKKKGLLGQGIWCCTGRWSGSTWGGRTETFPGGSSSSAERTSSSPAKSFPRPPSLSPPHSLPSQDLERDAHSPLEEVSISEILSRQKEETEARERLEATRAKVAAFSDWAGGEGGRDVGRGEKEGRMAIEAVFEGPE